MSAKAIAWCVAAGVLATAGHLAAIRCLDRIQPQVVLLAPTGSSVSPARLDPFGGRPWGASSEGIDEPPPDRDTSPAAGASPVSMPSAAAAAAMAAASEPNAF